MLDLLLSVDIRNLGIAACFISIFCTIIVIFKSGDKKIVSGRVVIMTPAEIERQRRSRNFYKTGTWITWIVVFSLLGLQYVYLV